MRGRKTEIWKKWRGLVSEQKQSGQSIAEFCRQRGLRTGHFFYWKKKLLDDAETPQFVAVKVAPDEASVIETKEPVATMMHGPAIEVRLSSGRSLLVEPGFDVVHLRQLLSVLEA